ncbi:unnamed protein product [Sphagnum balticum]
MELQLHMKKLCFDIAEGGIMDENPPLQALESLCSSESKHVQDSSRGKAEALDSPGAQWNLNELYPVCVAKETSGGDFKRHHAH